MTDTDESKMGFWMTSALVVGTIIGGAIFMLPVSLAPLGLNASIGWVISGLGAMCIVFGLAQISRFGGEGIQANIEREFGATSGFLATWSFWVSNWVAQASVAVATASALSFIGPQFGGSGWVVSIAVGCVVFLTDQTFNFTLPDGTTDPASVASGSLGCGDANVHLPQNIAAAAEFIMVEFKNRETFRR